MCAYNHEKYIGQAIRGVMKQQTNFKYRLIIGEDCSTDNTRKIIKKYLAKYPSKIEVLFHDKNVGAYENSNALFKKCTAKYIALCDGDDFWTDKNKLQKQVDFLEKNPAYSFCFHDVFFKIRNKKYRNYQWDAPVDSGINDLLKKGNYIVSVSILYRNHPDMLLFFQKFPDAPLGDYLLYVCAAQRGKIRFLRDRMAVYRVHTGGTWSQLGLENAFLKSLLVLEMLYDELEDQYKDNLKIQLLGTLEVMLRVKGPGILSNNKELERLLQKMGIPSFLLEYLKFNSVEKSRASYYSKNIPFWLLLGGIREKIKNRIFRF